MSRTWSEQQNRIFGWFERPLDHNRNLVVRARAGTGKTTTIIEGVNRAPDSGILLCAFNARIAKELTSRLTGGKAEAKTLHAVGFSIVRAFWEGLRVGDTRATDLTEQVCGLSTPDVIKRLVTKLHTKGREIVPLAKQGADLIDLAFDFELIPDGEWVARGWGHERVCALAYQAMHLAATVKPVKTGIDYSDMIYLPVVNGWTYPMNGLVVVDEAQDMTVAQLALARGVCKGRMCVVGDDRQAIYKFRGADSGSLDRLKSELQADEMGLTVTYRCGRVIVDFASTMVPDFQAAPSNPQGEIRRLAYDKLVEQVALGDFVLSRTNAPLVATAMSLLRQGKRTRVAGRDIGAGLKAILRTIAKGKGADSLPAMLEKLAIWKERQITRLVAAGKEAKVEQVEDQAAMIFGLAEGATSVHALEERIEALFTDDGLGQAGVITCSSVHRAKGLEADRVFILADTLKSHTDEEVNICYVAATRAKHELVMVYAPKAA
jgi:superfamily I DNA/RNA helicase